MKRIQREHVKDEVELMRQASGSMRQLHNSKQQLVAEQAAQERKEEEEEREIEKGDRKRGRRKEGVKQKGSQGE